MRLLRLGQLVNRFLLSAVAHQLATQGGRKVVLVLENDLTAVVEPEGFCTACRSCFDAQDVFRLRVQPDQLRQTAEKGTPTDATCPAGLAFLAQPLAIGPAQVVGYLVVGHVSDVKALEERLFALAQETDEKPAGLARRYWTTTKPKEVPWDGFANQLRQAAVPLVTLAAGAWHEYSETPQRLPEELDDLHALPREGDVKLQTALRRACLANDAEAGALLLPPDSATPLPEVVVFNVPSGLERKIALYRAEWEKELAHQAAGVIDLAHSQVLGATGLTAEGFRNAVITRSPSLGATAPICLFLYRKAQRRHPEQLALAQAWGRSLAILYLTVSSQEREAVCATTLNALGELVEAVETGNISEYAHVLVRWAARSTGGTAAVFVPDERREPKLLVHSAGADYRPPLVNAGRWLARQALARNCTLTSASGPADAEGNEETAAFVVAHPLGRGSNVHAVLTVAWPDARDGQAMNNHGDILATVARIGSALLDGFTHYQAMAEAHQHAVHLLAKAIETRFPWLSNHATRTALLARAMAVALGLSLPDAEEIYEAALLHDVGYLGSNTEFLDRPERLSESDRKALTEHVLKGAQLLEQNPLLRRLAPMVRHHRERWDGDGYPDRLRGREIPLGARILAVAEAFDAMVSDRPHRKALGLRQALLEIEAGSGRQFDPECAQVLLTALKSQDVKQAYINLFQEAAPPS